MPLRGLLVVYILREAERSKRVPPNRESAVCLGRLQFRDPTKASEFLTLDSRHCRKLVGGNSGIIVSLFARI